MRLSSPVRTPKLQLAVEHPLSGGHWNPPKKDIPSPKTKEEEGAPRSGRRGTITINSHLIPAGLVTIIPKKFFCCCGGSWYYIRLGNWHRDGESPVNLNSKASGILLQDFRSIGGNRLHSWRAQTKPRVR